MTSRRGFSGKCKGARSSVRLNPGAMPSVPLRETDLVEPQGPAGHDAPSAGGATERHGRPIGK